jgi:hypothetical protein
VKASLGENVDLNGRVSTGVVDGAGVDLLDGHIEDESSVKLCDSVVRRCQLEAIESKAGTRDKSSEEA